MASVAAKSIAVFDIEKGTVTRIFNDVPQADLLSDVILADDARQVIQLNGDGQFFIHEIASGRMPLSGRVVDDEIIVYTREGYYWSSYEGAHFVQLHFPGLPGVFPFQQFANVLDRPDVIKAQIASAAQPPVAPNLAPPPDLSVALAPAEAGSRPKLRITARGTAPLQRLKLYADGQPVSDVGLTGASLTRAIEVPPTGGARWLTAQVSDASGSSPIRKPCGCRRASLRRGSSTASSSVTMSIATGGSPCGTPATMPSGSAPCCSPTPGTATPRVPSNY